MGRKIKVSCCGLVCVEERWSGGQHYILGQSRIHTFGRSNIISAPADIKMREATGKGSSSCTCLGPCLGATSVALSVACLFIGYIDYLKILN